MYRAEDDRDPDGPNPHIRRAPASVDRLSARALHPCFAVSGRAGCRSVPPTAPRRHRVLAGALAVSTTLGPRIVPAGLGDTPQLAGMIARAVDETDLARWLVPHDGRRVQLMRDYIQLQLEQTLRHHGWIDTTAELAGAALWTPPAPATRPAGSVADAELVAITGPYADRFRAWHQLYGAYHPAGHTQMRVLAVRSDWQGQGLGGALLAARHAAFDERGHAAYLVAPSARAYALFLRYGYRLLPGAPVPLPDRGPALYPMARPAGAQQPG